MYKSEVQILFDVYLLDDKRYPVARVASQQTQNDATAIAVEAEEREGVRCIVVKS